MLTVSIIILVLSLSAFWIFRSKYHDGYASLAVTSVVSGIFFAVCLIQTCVMQSFTRQCYSEISSFYEMGIYNEADKFIQAQLDAGVIGDLSNGAVAPDINRFISQIYDKIEKYNAWSKEFEISNSSFWFDCFYYDPPKIYYFSREDMQKINFTFKKNVRGTSINLNIGGIPLTNGK